MQCEETRNVLFEYSEGGLPELERQAVDQHLQRCSDCSDLLSEIWEMALAASSWEEQPVPRWNRLANRRATFFGERQFILPWFNVAGVFASLLVLVALLFQVQIQQTEEGFTLAFAGDGNAVTRDELERHFSARDAELGQALTITAERLTAQQVATSQLLLRTILQTSREERREDLSDIMTVWNGDRQRMEQLTEESFGYVIRTQMAGQRQLQKLSTAVRNLDIQEDNNL